ncbi:MAG: integration host factor subunit beta [Treponema sp.]|nr:integration host factor subunit beta [Candidatus Treponema scatequi]
MTKADIVEQISNETGVDKKTVLTVVESMMSTVKQNLVEGNEVFLRGFGSFIIKERKEKIGRNIGANTSVTIPAHNIPAFKPCKEFVKEVSKL